MATRKPGKTAPADSGPVTLKEARALAASPTPARRIAMAGPRRAPAPVTPRGLADARADLQRQRDDERTRRIQEYRDVMRILEQRGVKGLQAPPSDRRRALVPRAATRTSLLRILAEGDSWFHYPVPTFGGIIPKLADRIGVEILNLAKAGDEVRFMLGVGERKELANQLRNGSPAGGQWDVLLFSGGGNDIVADPMMIWLKDFDPNIPPGQLINQPRFDSALALLRAGYQDLIGLRDTLSPNTHLIFHGYDFPIPDGRGICGFGPWLRPSFEARGFPGIQPGQIVIREMLVQFVSMLNTLATAHPKVTVLQTQGTLPSVTSSWHNELHPSRDGFNKITNVFHAKLKELFPDRVV